MLSLRETERLAEKMVMLRCKMKSNPGVSYDEELADLLVEIGPDIGQVLDWLERAEQR